MLDFLLVIIQAIAETAFYVLGIVAFLCYLLDRRKR